VRKGVGEGKGVGVGGGRGGVGGAVVAVDVHEFELCLGGDDPAALERAAALYQGELLEGLTLDEARFEEWLIAERLRLRELAMEALARLLAQQRGAGKLEAGGQTALRLVKLDPPQGAGHRKLLRLLCRPGRRRAPPPAIP